MVLIHHIQPDDLEWLVAMHSKSVCGFEGGVPDWLELLFEHSPHFKEVTDGQV